MADESEPIDAGADDVPAQFANRAYVRTGAQFSRITIGECVVGPKTMWHSAFVVPTEDLREIANLILTLLEQREKSQAQQESGGENGPTTT